MNRFKQIFTVFFTLLVLTNTGTAEETDFRIGTFYIPSMVDDENTGIFINLFKEIEKQTGKHFKIVLLPPKRAYEMFSKNELFGLFPTLDTGLQNAGIQNKVCKSEPFYMKRCYAFVLKDKPFITKVEHLEGKRVGLTHGYNYVLPELFSDKQIEIDYGPSDVLNMKKLSLGRIYAFIVEKQSGLKALKESNADNIHYNPESPLSEEKVYFAFQSSTEGKAICEKFSELLIQMKKNGIFEKILRKDE